MKIDGPRSNSNLHRWAIAVLRCGVCVGYLDGEGVRDKTESEISFVPAGSAPTFLLPCCQFY